MQTALNPILDMYRTQLEASRRLADVVFDGTQRMDRVMIDTAHRAITEQLTFVQAVSSARDPASVADLQATYMSRRPDNAMNCQRELFRVFVEIQSEIGKSAQYYVEQWAAALVAGTAAVPSAGARSGAADGTGDVASGMFSLWQAAMRDATDLAGRGMAAASAGLGNAASVAADAVQRTVEQGAAAATQAADSAAGAPAAAARAAGEAATAAAAFAQPAGARRESARQR